jgi:hypothetical protein
MKRPVAIALLAVLRAFAALGAFFFAVACGVAAANATPADGPGLAVFMSVVAAVAGFLGVAQMVTAIGLWTLRSFGRNGEMGLSVLGLLGFPIGTIISVLVLYYLTRPGVKLLFSGRSEASLTPEEHLLVQRDGSQPALVIVGAIVAVFGGIAMLGIIAAIAIPAALRARVSANEAGTIGTLRTVVSAQATWASSHGGAYATPACLHDPVSCGEAAGGPTYLDHDPTAGAAHSGYRYGFAQRAAVAVEAPPPDPTMPNVEGMTPEELARVVADMQAKADAQAAQAAAATPAGYVIWAVPESNTTGIRSFCADETGVVLEYGRDVVWSDPEGDSARCPEGGEPLR